MLVEYCYKRLQQRTEMVRNEQCDLKRYQKRRNDKIYIIDVQM